MQAAIIPGMLGMFQIEWDGLMLSYYALEQQLYSTRQEISHALYQGAYELEAFMMLLAVILQG